MNYKTFAAAFLCLIIMSGFFSKNIEACLSGDMNCDGTFNIFDLQKLINCIFETGSCEYGDINNDGSHNIFDLQQLINIIFNPALSNVIVNINTGVDSVTCGTFSQPCKTIPYGINRAYNYGASVLVKPGTYVLSDSIRINNSSKSLILKAEPSVIIEYTTFANFIVTSTANNVITGFTIHNMLYGEGIEIIGGRITIDNNTINTTTSSGIWVYNGGTITVMGNIITVNEGYNGAQGISIDGKSTATVSDNTITTKKSVGIWNDGTATVTNNTITSTDAEAVWNNGTSVITDNTIQEIIEETFGAVKTGVLEVFHGTATFNNNEIHVSGNLDTSGANHLMINNDAHVDLTYNVLTGAAGERSIVCAQNGTLSSGGDNSTDGRIVDCGALSYPLSGQTPVYPHLF